MALVAGFATHDVGVVPGIVGITLPARYRLHFDVFKGVPTDATLHFGACSEPEQLKATLQSGHFYVIDRGYAGYQLFLELLDAGSFVRGSRRR